VPEQLHHLADLVRDDFGVGLSFDLDAFNRLVESRILTPYHAFKKQYNKPARMLAVPATSKKKYIQ